MATTRPKYTRKTLGLTDTHAHIHFDEFTSDLAEVFANSHKNQVENIICVGVDDVDSRKALDFVRSARVQELAQGIGLYATAGLHPHDASKGSDALLSIKELIVDQDNRSQLVAVGECGLDYYRNLSSKPAQFRALEFQLGLALEQDLPVVFHIRDAWADFWPILQDHPGIRGVVHSFTGGPAEVERAHEFGLSFGLNGIMTFTKDAAQLEAAKAISADKLLLETDCPFLAPVPYRGKRNEPAYVSHTAQFLAELRGEKLEELATSTSRNAKALFKLG